MSDLSVSYLGLKLPNPVIAASSPLTASVEKVKACGDAGFGAVVLKSLFEEQIAHEANRMIGGMNYDANADAYDFLRSKSQEFQMNRYLELVEEARKAASIPVIASLNCVGGGVWTEYARQLQSAGADALELNVFILPSDVKTGSRDIENAYLDVLSQVKARVTIPVSMKLGSHFTGMASFFRRLCDAGADGLVLFNRYYSPDVDIERLQLKPSSIISSPEEMSTSLRWIALLSGEMSCDFSATTGVHDGASVIKQLLVGAKTVQVCSAALQRGLDIVGTMLKELTSWMERKEYASIEDFRGMLCQERSKHPEAYERSQYIKAIVGIE